MRNGKVPAGSCRGLAGSRLISVLKASISSAALRRSVVIGSPAGELTGALGHLGMAKHFLDGRCDRTPRHETRSAPPRRRRPSAAERRFRTGRHWRDHDRHACRWSARASSCRGHRGRRSRQRSASPASSETQSTISVFAPGFKRRGRFAAVLWWPAPAPAGRAGR